MFYLMVNVLFWLRYKCVVDVLFIYIDWILMGYSLNFKENEYVLYKIWYVVF